MNADTALLLQLYREAQVQPTLAFQAFAIQLLAENLRFDSAIWAVGYRTGAADQPSLTPILPLSYTWRTDPEGVTRWRAINRADKAIPIMLASPQRTVHIHTPTLFADRRDHDMLDYTKRFGRQCALVTGLSQPTSPLVQWSVLYRAQADDQFSDSETRQCESLMLHLAEALRINRLCQSKSDSGALPTDPWAASEAGGLIDSCGRILCAQDGFVSACRRQWRDFDGSRLPTAVMRQFTTYGRDLVRLPALVIRAQPIADFFWVVASVHEHATLPPRRMDVASLFAQGCTHKAIAKILGISPATVRNQIAASYRDLRVSSRPALRAALGQR